MRAALWFLALFGMAVAGALFVGNNQGTVTVFWPPFRIDLSLNLVLLLLAGLFLTLHVALRALAALFAMPGQARRWRLQHRERALYATLLDSLSHLVAGRFIRARKAAEATLTQEAALVRGGEELVYAGRLRVLSHLLAAESAHALQDRGAREAHLKLALEQASKRDAQETSEGVQLRAARWAFDDRDGSAALQWLDGLPQGASRRTLALRLRLKAARLARHPAAALETARLLAKHRAFPEAAAQGIVRGLALELINDAHDPAQLKKAWGQLDATERLMPEVAIQAVDRLLMLHGEVELGRQWLLPVWERVTGPSQTALSEGPSAKLIRALENALGAGSNAPDPAWLTRVEAARQDNPRDASLQYLAGMICMHHQLWGKAQQLLKQSLPLLQDAGLKRNAWRALAELAEQRGDAQAATEAYRNASKK